MSMDVEVKVNISTLWDMLEEHNWGYWESKDPNEYEEGAAWWAMIQRHADTLDKKRLVRDFEAHMNSGPDFGTPRLPKPPRPEET